MDEDFVGDLFRFFLLGIGGVYFFVQRADPTSVFTEFLGMATVFLGALYIIYRGLIIENQLSQVFYIVGALVSFALFFGLQFLFLAGDCSIDNPCPEGQFCASDHICHTPPDYTNEIKEFHIIERVNWNFGGFLIGISLIISALILKDTSFYKRIRQVFNRKNKNSLLETNENELKDK